MPINANVTNQQITASVGETQIDVSVAGGFGPSGANGAAASVQVGTVTTGAPGSSASVVNAGTSSAAVLNFTIPAGATGAQGQAGATGAQGIQGIQGVPGPAGPAGATGATGPAGSNATATTDASALVSGILPDARLSSAIARTSDVSAAVAAVVGAAPESLNTLQELSAALANDASFATTVTNSLAGKANVSHTHTVSAISDAGTAATRNVPATGNAGTTEVVLGSDTRLTDSRTPTSHAHGSISNFGTISDQISTAQANPVAFAGLTGLIGRGAWGTTSGTFCQGNDSRLSDARTPTAHKSTHATGGSDALAPADIGAAAVSHTHSALDIQIGTLDIARIPSLPASQIGSGTLDAARLPLATTAQAQDWNSTAVVMNPARMLDALTGWAQVLPTASANTSGGNTTAHNHVDFCDSGSTSGGTTSVFTNSNGGITNLLSPQSRGVDWSKRRYFCVRVRRESTNSSTGFGRFYYGFLNSSASGGQPTQRSIGFELRGTAPRLWLIAHNGSALTQFDTGWDVTGGSDLHNEFLVESSGGTVNVYVDGTLRGTTTGGPTTLSADSASGINYQVGNGGTAARTAFFISAARFTI